MGTYPIVGTSPMGTVADLETPTSMDVGASLP